MTMMSCPVAGDAQQHAAVPDAGSAEVRVVRVRVGGREELSIHPSVAEVAAAVAARLGLFRMHSLLTGGAVLTGPDVLARQLRLVRERVRFERRSAWVFGTAAVGIGDRPALVACVPGEAMLWADDLGFTLTVAGDAHRVEGHDGNPESVLSALIGDLPAYPRRVWLDQLLEPLAMLLEFADGQVDAVAGEEWPHWQETGR